MRTGPLARSTLRVVVAGQELLDAEKVLKIDVEGKEPRAIAGATKFLTSGGAPKAINMEIVNMKKSAQQALIDKLEGISYHLSHRHGMDALFVHRPGHH